MKRLKHCFKKGMAIVLTLAMVAGLIPAMSGGAVEVQAAADPGTEPSVSVYATKDQLMDGTFKPDSDGTATNIGMLVFGKKSGGSSQDWYILGKDEGVSGDNTIIFASSWIATGQVFNSSTSNNANTSSWSDCNYGEASVTEVYPNHYGASDLRVALKDMATDTNYFTMAEQGLMNATTVTTKDTKNDVSYTTTDKLYALAGDYNATIIKVGSDDSTVLAMRSYWSSGDYSWLRSPDLSTSSSALLVNPGIEVGTNTVNNAVITSNKKAGYQPASNLNLSDVLFASSAKAASSTDITANKLLLNPPMTLRFDGTGKNIGAAIYNAETGTIEVRKGTTSQTVALIVQGRGTVSGKENDWYYSRQITGTEVVNVTDIEAESNTPASIDLSACKIWLEITYTDGLIYAVNADKEIEKINTTYVTKEQLMNSFKPYSDGTAVNIGKLVFGKRKYNDDYIPMEWYILGEDEGVSGDNTIIFATIYMINSGQVFEDEDNNKSYDQSYGAYTNNPSEVGRNHYGASDLRVALQTMATDTNYFTTSEQGLMNDTTVTTKDMLNKDSSDNYLTYTTTDKLYALAADGYGSSYTTIKAGSSDQTVLAMSSYWKINPSWLRTPVGNSGVLAAMTDRKYVDESWNTATYTVRPASNLNLSSVLFASSAQAASPAGITVAKTIASDTAMNLRLDGTGKKIGTVIYDVAGNIIQATKGSTTSDVALVVQGNDGTNNWYYSKQITGTETINVSAIASETKTPASIDLSTCKIWLETTDATDEMIYAVNATEGTVSKYNVTVTNGSGSGEYIQGETVTITASAAPSGQKFKEWTVVSGNITLANSTSATTTFSMPAETVSVKAVYENTSNPGGGGSSSGGSSGGSTSEVTTVKDSESNITITICLTEVKIENGIASATVKTENMAKVIKQAVDNQSARIVFIVSETDAGNADKIRLTMTTSDVKQILDKTDADLVAATPAGDIILPQETLKEVVSVAGGNSITVEIDKVTAPTAAQKEAAGENSYIVEVTISSQDKAITTFGGNTLNIRLEIPVLLSGKNVAVIYIAADGKIEKMPGKTVTEGTKRYYEFTTTHLSTFALIEETETKEEESQPEENQPEETPTVSYPKKGTILTGSKTLRMYKITKAGLTGGTVQFIGTKDKTATSVTIPATVTFGGITYKVTSIAAGALKNNKVITKVVIGKNVTVIGTGAFSGCTKLQSVTIGKGVVSINSKAFYNCTSLTTLTIPASVTKIWDYAFKGCSKLSTLKINSTKLTTKTLSGLSMKGISTKTVIKVPKSKVKTYAALFVKKGLSKKVTVKSL